MTVNGDGEVIAVTVTEPRFTPAEKALLLASRRDDRIPRGRHGLPLAETTDPASQGRWVAEPVRDFAQQAIDRTEREYVKEYGDTAEPSSLIWRAKREG